MERRDWLIALVPIAVAACAGFVIDISGDFHWHLALGDETLRAGSIYDTDVHSYSFFGRPMVVSAWLADVLFAGSYRVAGYAGCFALRALLLVAAAVLLVVDARRRGATTLVAASIVTFAFAARFPGFYLRPEIFGLAMLAFVLFSLGQYQRTRRKRFLVSCIVACALWANLHGSVSVGLLAIGLFCAQDVLTEWFAGDRNRRELLWSLATPPAAFVAACINPEGLGVPLAVGVVSDLWVSQIAEWQSFSWRELTAMLQVALATVAITTAFAMSRTRKHAWLACYVAILIALTVAFRRFVAFAIIASIPLIAANIAAIAESVEPRRLWNVAGRALPAAAMAWSVLWIALSPLGARSLHVGIDETLTSHPVRACEFIRRAEQPGPVFNAYGMGSYLMFCLGKDYPVLIDGRAWSLYSSKFFARYIAATTSPDQWVNLSNDYPATWAVVGYTKFGSMAGHSRRWRTVYFDDTAVVFHHRDARPELDAFVELNPFRIADLADIPDDRRAAAHAELERQIERCPRCYRTDLARAFLAVADGDAQTVGAVIERIRRRGETPELAFLMGRFALMNGDGPTAARFFARFRELGGDRQLAAEMIERARKAPR